MKTFLKRIIPKQIFSLYHLFLAWSGAVFYGHPSEDLFIVGVTGTKGKSTTTELINALLETAGYTTALSGTIRFKIADTERPNKYKMSMPGRFFMQKFLSDARRAGCTHAVIEMTSEGAKQFRHKWINLDALVFTNLSPEHIESHGSYEKYRDAKLSIARELQNSSKKETFIVANHDDPEGEKFLSVPATYHIPYTLSHLENYTVNDTGISFRMNGTDFASPLRGEFNLYNILAAATLAEKIGVRDDVIKEALQKFTGVRGRVEYVKEGQDFDVIVDYAHTADSLEQLYKTFPNQKKICVLGSTGGGRDTWKRPEMGRIADEYCDEIILTNEDPYDEDPRKILNEMKQGFKTHTPKIIMDRREAIRTALMSAAERDVVLISGKGTDPYIMGPNGTKQEWDDATVVREELGKMK